MRRGLPFCVAALLVSVPSAATGDGTIELLPLAEAAELRAEPGHGAELLAIVPPGLLPLFATDEGWARVESGGVAGWVHPSIPRRPDDAGRVPPPSTADPDLLVAARRPLGDRERLLSLGGFLLYTDVDDAALLSRLGVLARETERIYRDRLGVDPRPEPGGTVVLFAREEDYRTLDGATAPGDGGRRSGHAVGGLAAIPGGDRGRRSLELTLLHELTHLLNRRALGEGAPPWLDEGLAEETALFRIDRKGRPSAAPLDRRSARAGSRVELYGPLAVLPELLAALAEDLEEGGLPPLADLLALDRRAFESAERPAAVYATFAFWIRYLLRGELADPFRAFLRQAAAGGGTGPDALAATLGRSVAELEPDFRRWLRVLPRRLGLPAGAPVPREGRR